MNRRQIYTLSAPIIRARMAELESDLKNTPWWRMYKRWALTQRLFVNRQIMLDIETEELLGLPTEEPRDR